jgi:DNA repair protein RecN (Recombination protein N)
LTTLRINNLALIDDISVELSEGFNVFTGETGAGKTIILRGIELLLGARGDVEKIRAGRDRLEVEGLFQVEAGSKAMELAREQGLADEEESGTLLLRRAMTGDGKSRCWINGRMCNVSTLAAVGEFLVDVHGQHEHQRLLKAGNHLEYLDACGGEEHQELLASYREAYRRWREALGDLEKSSVDEKRRLEEMEEMRSVISAIEKVSPRRGELEELERRLRAAREHENLFRLVNEALERLEPAEADGAVDRLASAQALLKKAAGIDSRLDQQSESLEEAWNRLSDTVREIRSYREEMSCGPEDIDAMEGRLFALRELYRKHGGGWDEVSGALEKARARLEELEGYNVRMDKLKEAVDERMEGMKQLAESLSSSRETLADRLKRAVASELADLGMEGYRFEVRVDRRAEFSESGRDKAEMLISPAQGEGMMPIARTASGGELARLMLALKMALARADQVPTLIFDEVDAGIGGMTAERIGEKLAALSGFHQVICVTHLPQIAARADRQLRIYKRSAGERTSTEIEPLDGEGREREITRMLGGSEETARRHARELIRRAKGGRRA